jgi:uncharacterized protein involved in exopolysaccharide biosynthesis
MTTIESHVDKNLATLEAQLHLWTAKLDEAKAKATVAGAKAKSASRQQLDDLNAKLQLARKKLDEAKAAGSDRWDTLKEGVENVWKELEGTFRKLIH